MTAEQSTTPVTFVEIPIAPGYDAGSDGHVYSRRTKGRVGLRSTRVQLREKTDKDGYRGVSIYDGIGRRSVKVHTLILTAFRGPCPPGMIACHYPDPDRANNRPENLMWGTQSTNQLHRREQGTAAIGSKNVRAKLTDDDVAEIRRTYETSGQTQKQIAARYGVHVSTINRMLHGDSWGGVMERKTYWHRNGWKRGMSRSSRRCEVVPARPPASVPDLPGSD